VGEAGVEPASLAAADFKFAVESRVNNYAPISYADAPNPVAPTVAPEFEIDRKQALLETLRGMGRDELLELLAEALTGGKP